jgi:hypothetical protein
MELLGTLFYLLLGLQQKTKKLSSKAAKMREERHKDQKYSTLSLLGRKATWLLPKPAVFG